MNKYEYLPLQNPTTVDMNQLMDQVNAKIDKVVKKEEKETILVLIGKTGHGKSSLGNTLLRRDVFEVSDDTTSVTKFAINHRDDNLVVFDTRGPFDGIEDNPKSVEFDITLQQLTMILKGCKKGVTAFIFVYAMSTKFSQEEIDTLEMYKHILGEDFLKTNGVFVLTHGLNFDCKYTFKEWCDKQKGPFEDIYNACDKRVVLVENKCTDSKKLEYRDQVLVLTKNLTEPYTMSHFNRNEKTRKKACFKWEVDDLKRKYNEKIKHLENKIKNKGKLTKELKMQITLLVNEITESNNEDEKYNLNLELEAAQKLYITSCCIL